MAATTWDDAVITPGLNLSADKLTGSTQLSALQYSTRTTTSKTSGKFYFEASYLDAYGPGGGDTGVGFAFAAYDCVSGAEGLGEQVMTDSIAMWSDGKMWITGFPPT